MDILQGKTLVFSDCHLGLNQSSISRLNIVIKVFKEMLKTIKEEKISNVIFAGDAFHDRRAIDVNVLNVAVKLFTALSKHCSVYLIVGNHDCHYKTQTSVNSVNIFRNDTNIHVIDEATEIMLNNEKCLLVPWLAELSKYSTGQFDLMFGHFNITDKYLIASYVEENTKNRSGKDLLSKLSEDELLSWNISGSENIGEEINSAMASKQKSSDLVGDFVNLVRECGTIYAGHIHQHKEFVSKKREFVFIGSPYQQNFGEMDSIDGFYVLDEQNKRKFHEIKDVPRFRKIFMSQILRRGLDAYDFSFVRNNIVKKIYDVDVDKLTEAKINQKIIDFAPYDELLPEYDIRIGSDNGSDVVENETLDLIRKSKIDYIKKYVDEIDSKSLEDLNINKDTLFEMLKSYYDKAEEVQKF